MRWGGLERKDAKLEPIRIAFVDLPRMLREIIKSTLDMHPEFDVVAEFSGDLPLGDVAAQSGATVLIAGTWNTGAEDLGEILVAHPRMKVLVVEGDGRQTTLHELHPRRVPLGEVSPESLVDIIKRLENRS